MSFEWHHLVRTIKCWTQLQPPGVEHDRIQEEGVGVMMILPTTQYLHIFSESNCPSQWRLTIKLFIDWCYSVPGLHWPCVNQIMKKCGRSWTVLQMLMIFIMFYFIMTIVVVSWAIMFYNDTRSGVHPHTTNNHGFMAAIFYHNALIH